MMTFTVITILFAFATKAFAQGTICFGNTPCLDPPMEYEYVSRVGGWILGVVGTPAVNSTTVYAAGSAVVPILKSDDAGYNWNLVESNPPGTSVTLLSLANEAGLLIGSMYNGFNGPNPNETSYIYYRSPDGSNNMADLSDIPDGNGNVVRGFGTNYRGLTQSRNGKVYGSFYAQYDITANPYLEYFLGSSTDFVNFDFIKLPYWSGCGLLPHAGDELPCPGIAFHFFDDNRGVGLFGQNWEGDYGQDIPTDQEYVAIIATTTDGGRTWTQRFRNDTFYNFVDLECIGETCVAAVTGLGYSIPDNQAEIWRTTDAGVTWSRVYATVNDNDADGGVMLTAIICEPSGLCFCAGNFRQQNIALVSYDLGLTWAYTNTPSNQDKDLVLDAYIYNSQMHLIGFSMADAVTSTWKLVQTTAAPLL